MLKHLTIGRRISEYMSKSNNARLRLNAYKCFINLIESEKPDFKKVWNNRMSAPKKKEETEKFVSALRMQGTVCRHDSSKLAMELLWLLENAEAGKRAGERTTVLQAD